MCFCREIARSRRFGSSVTKVPSTMTKPPSHTQLTSGLIHTCSTALFVYSFMFANTTYTSSWMVWCMRTSDVV